MYLDNEVEGKFIGRESSIREYEMGKKKWKNLIVTKELKLGNISYSFHVKDEKALIFTTPLDMFILQSHAINVNKISSQMFLECMEDSTLLLNTD